MNLLLLGGTRFLGPALITAARSRGHRLTLFNRGLQVSPIPLDDVEVLHGVRAELAECSGRRRWDAVIDTSGYAPADIEACRALRTDHYLFVSTCSVYAEHTRADADEDSPLHASGEDYGSLKVACERVEIDIPRTIVRPALVVGPHDPSGRFTTWPVRMARGGRVLAPGTPHDPVQLIDVRDLAEFLLHLAEQRILGIFNAHTPPRALDMGHLLGACAHPPGTELVWLPTPLLKELGLQPWTDLPVWIPPQGETAYFHLLRCERALQAGLRFRPLQQTCADTLAWWQALPEDSSLRQLTGLSPQRESQALQRSTSDPGLGG